MQSVTSSTFTLSNKYFHSLYALTFFCRLLFLVLENHKILSAFKGYAYIHSCFHTQISHSLSIDIQCNIYVSRIGIIHIQYNFCVCVSEGIKMKKIKSRLFRYGTKKVKVHKFSFLLPTHKHTLISLYYELVCFVPFFLLPTHVHE
jgi:hypothetical protein